MWSIFQISSEDSFKNKVKQIKNEVESVSDVQNHDYKTL